MKKIFPLFLFAALLFFACAADEDIITSPPEEEEEEEMMPPVRYLALGDSYTIGESVAQSQRYPVLLTADLRAAGLNVENPLIIARTGWTTANLQAGIEDADIEGRTYDLVSLLIGVNNQFQGRSLEEYKTEFAELLQQAVDFAGGDKDRVFVVSIPDYAFTPFGQSASNTSTISAEIDIFNAAAADITAENAIDFYNITPISRMGNDDPELVADDGLHPSGKQYQLWVDLFLEDVKDKLE